MKEREHTREDREDPKEYRKERLPHYSEQTGHRKRGKASKEERKEHVKYA